MTVERLPAVPKLNVRSRTVPAGYPATPNTFVTEGERRVLWLGPDEWLVLHPRGTEDGSTLDVSDTRVGFAVRGPQARSVLAHGCALDLHPAAFPVGSCAQTMLARAAVVLMLVADEPVFWLLVRSSFARYVAEWLDDAAVEYR
ncbi:sarcosine oxidase subunit gamma [Dactylosporangium sp. McL0621]|uniref:sarcosine oxidase subunit gamma n=1 Tax=Dactylosporangium sp. McL0621 TaxID=3415678 RepID=UPI003CFA6F0D